VKRDCRGGIDPCDIGEKSDSSTRRASTELNGKAVCNDRVEKNLNPVLTTLHLETTEGRRIIGTPQTSGK
jgi:hypothetical protein